jgi:oligopeptide transport system permease protein
MGRYFLRRVGYSILTIFLITTVVFFMLRAIPGGPFTRERAIPAEILRLIEEKYNLDAPLYEQYFDYMLGLLTFDLGPSYQKNRNIGK